MSEEKSTDIELDNIRIKTIRAILDHKPTNDDAKDRLTIMKEHEEKISKLHETQVKPTLAEITIVDPDDIAEDGTFTIWWWMKGAALNQEWKTNKKLYEIFSSEQLYEIAIRQEVIEVDEELITQNFERVS